MVAAASDGAWRGADCDGRRWRMAWPSATDDGDRARRQTQTTARPGLTCGRAAWSAVAAAAVGVAGTCVVVAGASGTFAAVADGAGAGGEAIAVAVAAAGRATRCSGSAASGCAGDDDGSGEIRTWHRVCGTC